MSEHILFFGDIEPGKKLFQPMAFPAFNKKAPTRKEHKAWPVICVFPEIQGVQSGSVSTSNTWEGHWGKTVKSVWLPGIFAALLFPLHFTIARPTETLENSINYLEEG